MKIKKILNNNAFITRNDNHQEIIVIGKAIAYGKHFNEEVDESKIYKTFVPVSKGDRKLILDMVNDIPVSFFLNEKIKSSLISFSLSFISWNDLYILPEFYLLV